MSDRHRLKFLGIGAMEGKARVFVAYSALCSCGEDVTAYHPSEVRELWHQHCGRSDESLRDHDFFRNAYVLSLIKHIGPDEVGERTASGQSSSSERTEP